MSLQAAFACTLSNLYSLTPSALRSELWALRSAVSAVSSQCYEVIAVGCWLCSVPAEVLIFRHINKKTYPTVYTLPTYIYESLLFYLINLRINFQTLVKNTSQTEEKNKKRKNNVRIWFYYVRNSFIYIFIFLMTYRSCFAV